MKGRSRGWLHSSRERRVRHRDGNAVVAGRDLSPQDVASGEKVVVINQTAAKALWPGKDALGKLMKVGGDDRRVVGIVGDVRHLGLEEGAGNEVYLPIRQVFDYSRLTLIVRTSLEPAPLAKAVRTALTPIAPNSRRTKSRRCRGWSTNPFRHGVSSPRSSADSRSSRCVSRCSGSMVSSRTP